MFQNRSRLISKCHWKWAKQSNKLASVIIQLETSNRTNESNVKFRSHKLTFEFRLTWSVNKCWAYFLQRMQISRKQIVKLGNTYTPTVEPEICFIRQLSRSFQSLSLEFALFTGRHRFRADSAESFKYLWILVAFAWSWWHEFFTRNPTCGGRRHNWPIRNGELSLRDM